MNVYLIKLVSRCRTSRGFTIVETLVAITVLMIAVAGPLVIASKALNAAIYARDQATAAFLAQESMEVIKNRRDNNIVGSSASAWLTGGTGMTLSACTGSTCDASAIDSNQFSSCPADPGCKLYFDPTSNGYMRTGAIASKFSRYFTLVQQAGSSNDYLATVYVSWNAGTVPNVVKLSSELTAAIR